MNNIKINDDVSINIENLIQTGMVIMANSGAGKSYTIRRIAEQAVKNIQVIIIDPEGEFSSLREKFDFILAGKDADVPVEIRSAEMLAVKLLELEKSAIIDLYELHPQQRQTYVKLFCEAIVNRPKKLYHPVLIILDEAHEYVPEGKPSEATWAVESLASRGKKRGQRLILATQRMAKISKNATAEANNKLIGRASQDIDMKRAGDELGFSKEKLVQLRQLKPGEFFAFGPAISDEIIKLKVGEVKTSHAKVGYKGSLKTPPPSSVIKKVLGELKDLPQEALKELTTIKELKQEITKLRSHRCPVVKVSSKEDINHAVNFAGKKIKMHYQLETKKINAELSAIIRNIGKAKSLLPDTISLISDFEPDASPTAETLKRFDFPSKQEIKEVQNTLEDRGVKIDLENVSETDNKPLTGGALRMLKVLVSRYPVKLTKAQLGTFADLKSRSGTFSTYLSTLKNQGFITNHGDHLTATEAGIDYLGEQPNPPQTSEEVIQLWKNNLTGGAKRMFEILVREYPTAMSKELLGESAGISHTSGTFNTYLSILKSNNIAEIVNGGFIKATEHLFNL